MKDKCLENHVIRSMKVQSQSKCELRCYQEADCVSYNYGSTHSDTLSCDLNNGTHLQVSSSDFVTKDHYIYRYIVVRNETSESFNFWYHFLFIWCRRAVFTFFSLVLHYYAMCLCIAPSVMWVSLWLTQTQKSKRNEAPKNKWENSQYLHCYLVLFVCLLVVSFCHFTCKIARIAFVTRFPATLKSALFVSILLFRIPVKAAPVR